MSEVTRSVTIKGTLYLDAGQATAGLKAEIEAELEGYEFSAYDGDATMAVDSVTIGDDEEPVP